MDRAEDRRRYFIVGSVILEIGLPLFRKRIEDDFTSRGFGSFQDFLSSQPIMHILFHLRHTNVWCSQDRANCKNQSKLPLNYKQWGLLFTKSNPPIHPRLCHSNYTANPAQMVDLDITLASLILLSCCNLVPAERTAIEEIRNCKNNYLSHNTDCKITHDEFDTLWSNLTTHVLQLDNGKQDDLVRIQNRPLDEALCTKYTGSLLDLHRKLEEMEANMTAKLEVILRNTELLCLKAQSDPQDKRQIPQRQQYKLGQDIFYLHQHITLWSEPYIQIGKILSVAMLDDGRLVLCDYYGRRLVICNTDTSLVYTIPFKRKPWGVTAVNNSTVAVTFHLPQRTCIQIYDIDKKIQTKSIQVPEWCAYITYVNNKFVVGSNGQIIIVDGQTKKIEKTIHVTLFNTILWICIALISPLRPLVYLHATADRIYLRNGRNKTLKCIRYSGEKVFSRVLPSNPCGITTLQDGSVYVVCYDGQVQHVSSDGQNCTTVTTEGLQLPYVVYNIGYNPKQRKLFTLSYEGELKVFCEI